MGSTLELPPLSPFGETTFSAESPRYLPKKKPPKPKKAKKLPKERPIYGGVGIIGKNAPVVGYHEPLKGKVEDNISETPTIEPSKSTEEYADELVRVLGIAGREGDKATEEKPSSFESSVVTTENAAPVMSNEIAAPEPVDTAPEPPPVAEPEQFATLVMSPDENADVLDLPADLAKAEEEGGAEQEKSKKPSHPSAVERETPGTAYEIRGGMTMFEYRQDVIKDYWRHSRVSDFQFGKLNPALATENKSLEQLLTAANDELQSTGRTDKLRVLKGFAAAIRERYWPADSNRAWEDLITDEKIYVRLAEMASLGVEMSGINNAQERARLTPERQAYFTARFDSYAKNNDIPDEFRDALLDSARLLKINDPSTETIISRDASVETQLPPATEKQTVARAGDFVVYDSASGENKVEIKKHYDKSLEQRPPQPKTIERPVSVELSQEGKDYDVAPEEVYPRRSAYQEQLAKNTPIDVSPATKFGFFDTVRRWWVSLFESEYGEGPGTYRYEGMDSSGEDQEGEVEATGLEDAQMQIRQFGIFTTKLKKRNK